MAVSVLPPAVAELRVSARLPSSAGWMATSPDTDANPVGIRSGNCEFIMRNFSDRDMPAPVVALKTPRFSCNPEVDPDVGKTGAVGHVMVELNDDE